MDQITHSEWHGNWKSYVLGYVLSILFTVAAYLFVVEKILAEWNLVHALTGLAVTQALVQLLCFLHLAGERKPRWNLTVFLFTILVLTILILGSIWIMHSLQTRVMPMADPIF